MASIKFINSIDWNGRTSFNFDYSSRKFYLHVFHFSTIKSHTEMLITFKDLASYYENWAFHRLIWINVFITTIVRTAPYSERNQYEIV